MVRAWAKCEGLLMLGRGLLRRLVVLVVLTLATVGCRAGCDGTVCLSGGGMWH